MPSLDNMLLFVVASVLLVLTPGPNLLYLISRTCLLYTSPSPRD